MMLIGGPLRFDKLSYFTFAFKHDTNESGCEKSWLFAYPRQRRRTAAQ